MPPSLTWTASVDRRALVAAGYELIEFTTLRREVVAAAAGWTGGVRASTTQRRTGSTGSAADLAGRLGVRIRNLDDLAALHGYVLEPALRSGTALVIESEQRLTRLPPEGTSTLTSLIRTHSSARSTVPHACIVVLVPEPPRPMPSAAFELDAEQRRAVDAHDGVVQVVAPAGSGKTAVLIERVRELLRRGVPAEQILCTTFNRDARVELQERLRAVGVQSVAARTFHSVGWWLMREEGLARRNGVREPSFNQWRRLCAIGLRETGTWVEPADARAAISGIKLGLLATPREFAEQADGHPDGETLATSTSTMNAS